MQAPPLTHHRSHLPGRIPELLPRGTDSGGDVEQFATINARYSLDMDVDSVPALCERYGLTFPEP